MNLSMGASLLAVAKNIYYTYKREGRANNIIIVMYKYYSDMHF